MFRETKRRRPRSPRTDDGRATEHVWASPPVVRGLTTLLGVAAAGFLVWLATQFDLGSTGEYWAAMGILAGAGVCPRASRSSSAAGRSGAPRSISPGVFFLAFLPTLDRGRVASSSPRGRRDTDEGEQVAGWIRDIGLGGARRGPDRLPGRPRVRSGHRLRVHVRHDGARARALVDRETSRARRGRTRLPRARPRRDDERTVRPPGDASVQPTLGASTPSRQGWTRSRRRADTERAMDAARPSTPRPRRRPGSYAISPRSTAWRTPTARAAGSARARARLRPGGLLVGALGAAARGADVALGA